MTIDLDDVQGNILRGYRLPDVRYLLLQLTSPEGGRALLQLLLQGGDGVPAVQNAAEWQDKPTACLNVGITFDAFAALGVPDNVAATFPDAFRAGSAARSVQSANETTAPWYLLGIGDVGESSPNLWQFGGPLNTAVHVVVSIFSNEETAPRRVDITAALKVTFEANGVVEVGVLDGHTFDHGRVHFGFRDGIAQPQIAGRPGDRVPDMQPDALTGDFLLGKDYVNAYRGNYLADIPPSLGDNGTYMALRKLEQHCKAFDDYVTTAGRHFDMDPEMVAAKMVGRWRNGVPLAVSPDTPDVEIDDSRLNEFDYASTEDHPANFDDADGIRCPFGAHVRRMNPRGGPVTGLQHNRRIVRRGVPYGPEWTGEEDFVERGLLGSFLCGDLESQFEFLYKVWANLDISFPGVRGTRDPIIGWQPDVGGRFEVPSGDVRGQLVSSDVPRLVTTRGSLYLFVPGLGGLATLAAGQW